MSELDSSALADDKVETAVLRVLQGPGPKGRFVTELLAVLKRSAVQAEEVERALAELESAGAVMLRDHFCADPHLAGVDLRVAAPVQNEFGPDAELHAIQAIDQAWSKWLGEYLANHRCE